MNNIEEIKKLEEGLIAAELGPDPKYFDSVLDNDAILDGAKMKSKIIAAHQPNSDAPKFTNVEMSDFNYVDQGTAVVVTCVGKYTSAKWSGSLKFMRVWLKKNGRWQIVAGSTGAL